jgi:anti-anti-sigma regulatory factor
MSQQRIEAVRLRYAPGAGQGLRAALIAALEGGASEVVLDLGRSPRLDEAALRELILLLRAARELGGDVTLQIGDERTREIVSRAALDRIFTIEPAETEVRA